MGIQYTISPIILAFFVAEILAVTEPTSMTLLEDQLYITNQGQNSKLDFDCQARVGLCNFQYLILPPGWRAQGNTLLFPTSELSSIRSFMVQARISEPTGDYMIRNIIIDFENGKGSFSSTLYDSNVGG